MSLPTQINNAVISEEKDEMRLSFNCVGYNGEDNTQQVFNEIKRRSVEHNGDNEWYNVHHNFAARLVKHPEKVEIEIKEKNNPPTSSGHSIILTVFPAVLLQWGIIEDDQREKLNTKIQESEPAKKRNNPAEKGSTFSL